ncbi:hypothetical protein KDL45_11050 [bacterium]|nr:hypothetical protein [bacterium]
MRRAFAMVLGLGIALLIGGITARAMVRNVSPEFADATELTERWLAEPDVERRDTNLIYVFRRLLETDHVDLARSMVAPALTAFERRDRLDEIDALLSNSPLIAPDAPRALEITSAWIEAHARAGGYRRVRNLLPRLLRLAEAPGKADAVRINRTRIEMTMLLSLAPIPTGTPDGDVGEPSREWSALARLAADPDAPFELPEELAGEATAALRSVSTKATIAAGGIYAIGQTMSRALRAGATPELADAVQRMVALMGEQPDRAEELAWFASLIDDSDVPTLRCLHALARDILDDKSYQHGEMRPVPDGYPAPAERCAMGG